MVAVKGLRLVCSASTSEHRVEDVEDELLGRVLQQQHYRGSFSSSTARWLGTQRWQALHRSVYAVAALAVLHFYWMRAGKNNFAEVWVYACVLGSLLVYRFLRWLQKKFPA